MRLHNNSARKQRRICADKKIDSFAAFQKIFCRVPLLLLKRQTDKKAFARRKQKKTDVRVISLRRSRQMNERIG